MPRDLWDIGRKVAYNPSWGKRILHSSFADPFRRKSVSRIGTMVIKGAITFIPVPAIAKDIISTAVEKGLQFARKKQLEYKKNKHQTGDMAHKVKWGWKDLDLEDMDRYRWKVKHAADMLKEAVDTLIQNAPVTASICNDVVRAISKKEYLDKRIQKIREQLEITTQLCTLTDQWLTQIEQWVQTNNYQEILESFARVAQQLPDNDEQHMKCDKEYCAHGDKARFWDKNPKLTAGVALVTKHLVDFAPGPLNKDTYSSDHYTKVD